VIGRGFTEADDLERAPGVLILSHALWVTRFGGDLGVLGRSVRVDDRPYTVVGVMPEDFAFPSPDIQFWESLAYASRVSNHFYLRPVGRLKDSVGRPAAREYVAGEEWIIPAYDDRPDRIEPLQVMSLLAYSVRNAPTTLLLIQGAALAVLLVACFNVTNLVLVRAVTREGEVALRAVLGAGRERLARLALTETALVGLAGGGLGIVLAHGIIRVSLSALPGGIPLQERIVLGAPVLAAGLLLAIGAGALIGVLPAFRTSRVDLRARLQPSARGFTEERARTRVWSLLVSAQLAVALVLLVGGGLLLQSFANLRNVDPGLDPQQVLVASVPVPASRYPDQASRKSFYDELVRRLEARPRVKRAAVVAYAPFSGSWSDGSSEVEGKEALSEDAGFTEFQVVSPGYFETMGIPLHTGRGFDHRDGVDGLPVAIVNETLERRHFPDGSALGHRIRPAGGDSWSTIIGVVGDVTHRGLDTPPTPQIYTPYSAAGGPDRMPVVLRADGDPLSLSGAVREIVADMDPNIPVPTSYSLESGMERTMAGDRFQTWILGSFAATALLLAFIGVYGVAAHAVTLRAREFGIRKALGADSARVVRDVVRGSSLVIATGIAVGLAAALSLAGVMEGYLFGVHAMDPLVFGVVTVVLFLSAVLATYLPARRAGRLHPVEAMQSE